MRSAASALGALAAITLAVPVSAREGRVALTFDDLPALTILQDQAYVDYTNAMILRGLRRHRFSAIGFVNQGKIDELQRDRQIAILSRWLDAGMTLGNHTFSHESPTTLGAAAYLADVQLGEPVIRGLLAARGQSLRWFRHPFLERGYPASIKQTIEAWLTAQGYRIAPVTIDADDWEFAEPYDDAIARHDRKRQRRLLRTYIAYTATRIDWARRSARALFGRDISHVMLLHCTRLNADAFDKLAALLRRMKLRPVRLEEAMRDPVYRTPDTYVGEYGPDWLVRWSSILHRPLATRGDEDPPKWVQVEYDKVDNDRRPDPVSVSPTSSFDERHVAFHRQMNQLQRE